MTKSLAVFAKFEKRDIDPHLVVQMCSEKRLAMRLLNGHCHDDAADVLAFAKARADAETCLD